MVFSTNGKRPVYLLLCNIALGTSKQIKIIKIKQTFYVITVLENSHICPFFFSWKHDTYLFNFCPSKWDSGSVTIKNTHYVILNPNNFSSNLISTHKRRQFKWLSDEQSGTICISPALFLHPWTIHQEFCKLPKWWDSSTALGSLSSSSFLCSKLIWLCSCLKRWMLLYCDKLNWSH